MESGCSSAALSTTRTTAMMKMAPASTIFLLLLFCSTVPPTGSQTECDEYAAAGGDFVVPLNSKQKDQVILQWRHNGSVVFSRTGGQLLSGKSDDVDKSGSLKLKNVTTSQSGTYTPAVHNADRIAEKHLKTTRLCVIAPVSKPSVTIACEESKKVTFTCTVHPVSDERQVVRPNIALRPGDREFQFRSLHFSAPLLQKDLPLKKTLTVVWLQGSKLVGKKNEWSLKFDAKSVAQDKFACNVSNVASFVASEPSTQTCYTSILPDKVFGISIWLVIGGGGGIVLLLIVIVIVCCIRTRRMKRIRLKEEDELRLQWANAGHHQCRQPADRHHRQPAGRHHHQPAGRHHHHHQHSHQQPQPAGHTGPRPSRSRQHRDQQQTPQSTPPDYGQPLPTPRRAAPKGRKPAAEEDTEQPPPLPQPRKKTPRTQRE